MSHMTIQTATDRRAAAAARQRASRARRAQPRQPIECRCCGSLWVPTRQGLYCSRQCIERAAHLRRDVLGEGHWTRRDQTSRLAAWLQAAGVRRLHGAWRTSRGARAALEGDYAERRRLLETHRHLLEPMTEWQAVDTGWLMGPQFGRASHSSMAQVDPEQAREHSGGSRW